MITPSFGLTATERVLPKLALDFTTASLDSRITFNRTTSASNPATYVNSSGVITAATNNQPRFDYDPVTLACKGLLIEEARTNLQKQSENLSDSVWTQSAVSVVTDGTLAPDNSTAMYKIIPNTTSTLHNIVTTTAITTTASTAYTASIFVKASGYSYFAFGFNASSGEYVSASFNLVSKTANIAFTGAYTNASANIVEFANNVFRCTVTATTSTTTSQALRYGPSPTGTWTNSGRGFGVYAGDGTSGIYAWGAQFELGAFPTSYIPTTTTSLTRNADVATMTGTNFSDWFNATEGAFMIRGFATSGSGRRYIQLDNTGNTDRMLLQTGTGAQFESRTSGSTDVAIDAGTAAADVFNNMCFAYKLNNFGLAINGGATVTDTSGAVPSLDRVQLGFGGELNGYLARVFYYPQRLTNAEIQAFSK